MSEHEESGEQFVTKVAAGSVDDAVAKLSELVSNHGLVLFAVIDHSGEARQRGLTLRDTKVVIFGSPEAGTPVMEAVPAVALELPLKVLVWDNGGVTTVNYLAPTALAARYGLNDALASALAGIGPLTDALVAAQ